MFCRLIQEKVLMSEGGFNMDVSLTEPLPLLLATYSSSERVALSTPHALSDRLPYLHRNGELLSEGASDFPANEVKKRLRRLMFPLNHPGKLATKCSPV